MLESLEAAVVAGNGAQAMAQIKASLARAKEAATASTKGTPAAPTAPAPAGGATDPLQPVLPTSQKDVRLVDGKAPPGLVAVTHTPATSSAGSADGRGRVLNTGTTAGDAPMGGGGGGGVGAGGGNGTA